MRRYPSPNSVQFAFEPDQARGVDCGNEIGWILLTWAKSCQKRKCKRYRTSGEERYRKQRERNWSRTELGRPGCSQLDFNI